jgi:hypothetical protein
VQPDNTNQNGTQNEGIRGVQVVPNLAIAIQGTVTIDVDVCTSKLEESRRVLVDLLERIGLPVVGVVGELDCSENFYNNMD